MRSVSIVGLGWLGYPLARHLRNIGWDVKGSKRTFEGTEQMRLERIETYHLEINPELNADPDDLASLLSVDSLIINIPPSEYFFNAESYVQGIENLVTEALIFGVTHIIFISSTVVFPEITGEFNEESQPNPTSELGKALLEVEQWLYQIPDIDVDIVRFAGLVGYDRHPVHRLSGKTDLKNGEMPINLVHIEDCIRAIQLLLEAPSYHRLYHLCAPIHPTRQSYYTEMAEKLGISAPHFAPSEPIKRIILADKICRELDFVYQFPNPNEFLALSEDFA